MIEALKFEFSYKTDFSNSFRCKSLVGQYDLEDKETIQHYKGNYSLPDKWNIGLIVGNSGTGKTSIAKNVFGQFSKLDWNDKPLIDNFSDKFSMDQITHSLSSVGFNCVPYWLKPFKVLSNGEKTRVELARLALENENVVYDEFTSLVDRDVAKCMSHSVKKLFKSLNKKFVAVTCHHDIINWLEPDWIYNTDTKEYTLPKSLGGAPSNSIFTESKKPHGTIIKSIII
tara:strand:+ start:1344 stop:2027 length:684 start_codon:yes stop_codon:yes gene_type:complete